MTLLGQWFVAPFVDYPFLRRALVACLALALGAGPAGVFLLLRRMSLIGDTLAHSILPGAAAGFILAGLSVPAMSLGGFITGAAVALASGMVSRATPLKEDASMAAFFLISLATGVLLVSTHGSAIDLIHVLFGSILAVDNHSLILMAATTTASLAAFAIIYRGLVVDCFDPQFLNAVGGGGGLYHTLFLLLVVANMVSGFLALGSLMAVGLMILPATAARFWARQVWSMIVLSSVLALVSGYLGLVFSFLFDLPSGPAIVLTSGVLYVASMAAGPNGGLLSRSLRRRHFRS
jgi:zinc/manganese transport system permease protein